MSEPRVQQKLVHINYFKTAKKACTVMWAEFPHTVFTGVSTASATAKHVQTCVYGYSCTIAILLTHSFYRSLPVLGA